jgi:hypothetical protein
MKKLIMAVSLLTILNACHTSSSSTSVTPSAPTSTFNITYNGKTYHLTSSAPGTVPVTVISAITGSSSSPVAEWTVSTGATDSHIQCTFGGAKFNNMSTAIGTYRSGCGSGVTISSLYLLDKDDGNKTYETDCTGHDSTSTLTVTVASATECKGTFNVILSYNGNYYPATGDFDYKH